MIPTPPTRQRQRQRPATASTASGGSARRAVVAPRPSSSASLRSGRSSRGSTCRSPASFARLAQTQRAASFSNLVLARLQMLHPTLGRRRQELGRELAAGAGRGLAAEPSLRGSLPARITMGWVAGGSAELAAVDREVAAIHAALITAPSTPAPAAEQQPEAASDSSPVATTPRRRHRRLPPVHVAGRPLTLETLLRDKIMQKGAGGANQLRKAFKLFDQDLSGEISIPEFKAFLESVHVKVNGETMQRFFDKWTGGSDVGVLNYNAFIATVLPPDYPQRKNAFSADVASL